MATAAETGKVSKITRSTVAATAAFPGKSMVAGMNGKKGIMIQG